MLQTNEVILPFSEAGWDKYCRSFPWSLKIFKVGLDILRRIPLIGTVFAIYVWAPLMGFFCGILAVVDLFGHKRQLVKFHGVEGRSDGLIYKIDMTVNRGPFAEELLRLNTGKSLPDYKKDFSRKQKIKLILIILFFLLLMILAAFSVVNL